MLTPDLVTGLPTSALSNLVGLLETLDGSVKEVDDCEMFVIGVESGLAGAIHMIDAELQRRPSIDHR
jgi:hypothetical protein